MQHKGYIPSTTIGWCSLNATSLDPSLERWADGRCLLVTYLPGRAKSAHPYPLSRRRRRR